MDQTEFQLWMKSKLEKECPHTAVIFYGEYDGYLTFALITEQNPKYVGYAVTGFPVYALVLLGDFEHCRLVSDVDMKITKFFKLCVQQTGLASSNASKRGCLSINLQGLMPYGTRARG